MKDDYIDMDATHRDDAPPKTPIWSILICTIPPRKVMLNALLNELWYQINDRELGEDIEILWLTDEDGERMSIGQKRQDLINQAKGEYVNFIDDDDWVTPDYIRKIHTALLKAPDVVGITGTMTINGNQRKSKKFIHSSIHKSYYELDGVYYRPPNHLNPMKRSIAERVPFEFKSHKEDTDWAMALCELKPYDRELFIKDVIYYYRYKTKAIWK